MKEVAPSPRLNGRIGTWIRWRWSKRMACWVTVRQHRVKFVYASDIVPSEWTSWFWETISENAPFSWGDNNYTLVSPGVFAGHVARSMHPSIKVSGLDLFLERVRALPRGTYINLEGKAKSIERKRAG